MSKGYYQILTKKLYLAFSTTERHYEFNILPFGLSSTRNVLMRMMRMLLNHLNDRAISNFIDDIMICNGNVWGASNLLSNLLNLLAELDLTVNPIKCQLVFNCLDFWGNTVAQGYMYPGSKNVEKLRNAPRLQTKVICIAMQVLPEEYQKLQLHSCTFVRCHLERST